MRKIILCSCTAMLANLTIADTVLYQNDFSGNQPAGWNRKGKAEVITVTDLPGAGQVKFLKLTNHPSYPSTGCGFNALFKPKDMGLITVDYLIRPGNGANRGLAVQDVKGRQNVVLLFRNGKVIYYNGGAFKSFPLDMRYYHFRYVLDPYTKTYTLYVDDMEKPLARNLHYRHHDVGEPAVLRIFGCENPEAELLLGPIKVTQAPEDPEQKKRYENRISREDMRKQLLLSESARKRKYAFTVESPLCKIQENYGGLPQERAELLLSGNETGSFQIPLLALPGHPFTGVKVSLKSDSNQLALRSYYLDFISTVKETPPERFGDVLKPGTAFSFKPTEFAVIWIDAKLSAKAPAGVYRASITISPAGFEPMQIPLTVKATGLELPRQASLPTAFCFNQEWATQFFNTALPTDKMRKIIDFILEHRLEPMNLWGGNVDLGEEYLEHAAANGKTMLFLRVDKNFNANKPHYHELIKKYEGKLRPIFFGYDEVLLSLEKNPDLLAQMKRDYDAAKAEFPKVPRLSTAAIDRRLHGIVDIWCPLFDHYNQQDAALRQKAGEEVWWYTTDYPLYPYPNFNLDAPGIEPRIIPYLTKKVGATGLLYWGLNREWMSNSPVEGKAITAEDIAKRSLTWMTPKIKEQLSKGEIRWPEIPWLPYFRSTISGRLARQNGGGNLMYPGADFEAYPSARLKNLRDGLQDFEYLVMLENRVKELKVRKLAPALAAKAEALLRIPDAVVKAPTAYTQDSDTLLEFRKKLIECVIEINNALAADRKN